jgi:hypothetical protein
MRITEKMIILRMFSKKGDKETDKEKVVKGRDIAAGIGIGTAAGIAGVAANSAFVKKLRNAKSIDPEEEKKLREELIKKAKKQGTRTINTNAENSMAVGTSEGKVIRKALAKLAKKDRKKYEAIKEATKYPGMDGVLEHIGKDQIILGKGRLSEADVLSHELGHTQFLEKGRSKDVIAKTAHRLNAVSKMGTMGLTGSAVYGAHGYANGLKAAKMESEGKKESFGHRIKATGLPALVAAPILITEGAATGKGLKLLKQAGASKRAMKTARKTLGNAYGTYASIAAGNVAAGEGGRLVGKAVGKKRYKKEKEKEKENKK